MIIPNTTLTVLRTNEASPPLDANGDPVDSDTAVATGLPATVTEKQQRSYNPASGVTAYRDVYLIELRPSAFTFTERDRVRDERRGTVYQVENVALSPAQLMAGNIRLTCSLVG
jgi:hypothetical protein